MPENSYTESTEETEIHRDIKKWAIEHRLHRFFPVLALASQDSAKNLCVSLNSLRSSV